MGVFFLNLPSAKLPVTLVRDVLGKLAIKKRQSAHKSEQAAFAKHDLLFIGRADSGRHGRQRRGLQPLSKGNARHLHQGGRAQNRKVQGLDFAELGITDVVELLRNANVEAVLADFDRKDPDEDPVIHFYELVLKEYDAAQKVTRGVFYTLRPVVGFIVRWVDEVRRTEFRLEDGLASAASWGKVIAALKSKEGAEITLPEGAKAGEPFVRILDPATGTGTHLVECVDLIHKTMVAKWKAAGKRASEIRTLWNVYVPAHLLPRLTRFELMMAPYAIAHVKLDLKLADTGYTFGSDARA